MNTRKTLVEDSLALLQQGIQLLSELDASLYSKAEPAVSSSSIGGHVRHCLDYYGRFLDGAPTGRVDYDLRERDERIERELEAALERLRDLAGGLRQLAGTPGLRELQVKMDSRCQDERAPWAQSSVERELQFLCSHAVHHFALIAVILRLNGRSPAEGFGVAPSTLRHWQEQPACAR